jgi:hypothetical protein
MKKYLLAISIIMIGAVIFPACSGRKANTLQTAENETVTVDAAQLDFPLNINLFQYSVDHNDIKNEALYNVYRANISNALRTHTITRQRRDAGMRS